MIEADEQQEKVEEQMIMEAEAKEQDDSEEVDLGALRKKTKYTVEDITLDLDKKMKIVKKSKKQNKEEDA